MNRRGVALTKVQLEQFLADVSECQPEYASFFLFLSSVPFFASELLALSVEDITNPDGTLRKTLCINGVVFLLSDWQQWYLSGLLRETSGCVFRLTDGSKLSMERLRKFLYRYNQSHATHMTLTSFRRYYLMSQLSTKQKDVTELCSEVHMRPGRLYQYLA